MKKLVIWHIARLAICSALIAGTGLANGPNPDIGDTSFSPESPADSATMATSILDSLPHTTASQESADQRLLAVDSLESDSVHQETTVAEDSTSSRLAPIPVEEFRQMDNRAFGVGERLEFEISYGPVKAGTAVMEVKDIVQLSGRPCYHIISTAKSNKVFSAFYKVEDRVESFFDVLGLFSWKFVQHLREGKYRADRFAIYDQVNHTATTNRGTMDIPAYVQDVLSTMYYVRTQELVVGQILSVDNHSGRKIYPLAVNVLRREQVEVPSGTFDCFVLEPMLQAGGLFKHEGRIWVWLTADQKKMPVLMKTKVIIGTVDAKLAKFRLGKISSPGESHVKTSSHGFSQD